ncbi:MAG: MmgE/PrpD family protein [Albidovulum sp.]|nr:MmgE/PrpD family protein [Albidovulum sp.]
MSKASPTELVAAHIAKACATPLPPEVARKARLHLLDTLAAMIDGTQLRAGRQAVSFAALTGGPPHSGIPGTVLVTDAVTAAFAGAMAAHADETDDSHLGGRFHPGCSVVPSALSVAQLRAASGEELLRAIAAGYDIGARFTKALGFTAPRSGSHSTHCLGANFGAAAAAGALAGLEEVQCEHLLSYATQQASGLAYWERDADHVEKAFDFGGMGARNGVFAALFVAGGATGVSESLTGRHSYLSSFAERARPDELFEGLGEGFEVMSATIKKWSVGSPIQAVLDSAASLVESPYLSDREIRRVRVVMPDDRIEIVDNNEMPEVCVQHLVALALCDRGITNSSIRDHSRMRDGDVLSYRRLVELVPSRSLTEAWPARQAIVEIELRDGRKFSKRTRAVLGTPDNPMSEEQVEEKARNLISTRIGGEAADLLISAVRNIATLADVRDLRPLWMPR